MSHIVFYAPGTDSASAAEAVTSPHGHLTVGFQNLHPGFRSPVGFASHSASRCPIPPVLSLPGELPMTGILTATTDSPASGTSSPRYRCSHLYRSDSEDSSDGGDSPTSAPSHQDRRPSVTFAEDTKARQVAMVEQLRRNALMRLQFDNATAGEGRCAVVHEGCEHAREEGLHDGAEDKGHHGAALGFHCGKWRSSKRRATPYPKQEAGGYFDDDAAADT